jgi:hypothetical protein
MKTNDLVTNLEEKIKYYNAGEFDLIDENGDIINCVQMDYDNKLIRLYRKSNTNMDAVNVKQEQVYYDNGGLMPSVKPKPTDTIVW